jgi:mannose-1-phosphate guanylyltransferase
MGQTRKESACHHTPLKDLLSIAHQTQPKQLSQLPIKKTYLKKTKARLNTLLVRKIKKLEKYHKKDIQQHHNF